MVSNAGGLAGRELLLRAAYAALWRDRPGPVWRRTGSSWEIAGRRSCPPAPLSARSSPPPMESTTGGHFSIGG